MVPRIGSGIPELYGADRVYARNARLSVRRCVCGRRSGVAVQMDTTGYAGRQSGRLSGLVATAAMIDRLGHRRRGFVSRRARSAARAQQSERGLDMKAKGFTLIELVIVVAIVAILAAIALPSYTKQIQKSRRAQGKADLTEIAQGAERFYSINRTYTGYAPDITVSPRDSGATVAYRPLTYAATANGRGYTLLATPVGPQATDLCGNLYLDNTGVKHHAQGDDVSCGWGTVGP